MKRMLLTLFKRLGVSMRDVCPSRSHTCKFANPLELVELDKGQCLSNDASARKERKVTGFPVRQAAIGLLAFISSIANCQQDRWWHYGVNARIDMLNPTVAILGGCIATTEGLACISDDSGNLLFATDGVTVYNRLCAIMPNGTALAGDPSSTQSSIIVKQPGSTNIYYIFTAPVAFTGIGVCYSIVDMSLAAGFGAVTSKNVLMLPSPVNEKVTAVQHCNGEDFWILTKGCCSNGNYYAWGFTASGVNMTPVVSPGGYAAPLNQSQTGFGYLKSNSAGTMLAAAHYGTSGQLPGNRVEIANFNKATGVVSGITSLGAVNGAYGVEFSASGRFLYCSTNQGQVFQWDLCTTGYPRVLIASTGPFLGALQITRHNTIYSPRGTQSGITAILNPEGAGLACNLVNPYIIGPTGARFGLPNFPASYAAPQTQLTSMQVDCDIFSFSLFNQSCFSENPVSFLWEFGDGSTSFLANPTHQYASPGTYFVTCTIQFQCRTEVLTTTVNASGIDLSEIIMN